MQVRSSQPKTVWGMDDAQILAARRLGWQVFCCVFFTIYLVSPENQASHARSCKTWAYIVSSPGCPFLLSLVHQTSKISTSSAWFMVHPLNLWEQRSSLERKAGLTIKVLVGKKILVLSLLLLKEVRKVILELCFFGRYQKMQINA